MQAKWMVLVFALAGCIPMPPGANSRDVGGECNTDRDCVDQCTKDSSFDNGMCTLDCNSDSDCPSGSECVKDDNGICAVSCETDRDCEGFGSRWFCGERDRMSGGGTRVCRTQG